MEWTSVISREDRARDAVEEAVRQLSERTEAAFDLVVVFTSRHHAAASAEVASLLHQSFPNATIVGCAAASVVGDAQEEEAAPALSVTAAHLPGVDVRASAVTREPGWLDNVAEEDSVAILAVVDSFTTEPSELLQELDELYPGATKFGGLASGGVDPGSHILFFADKALQQGAVIVSFSGDVAVDTIVAQGCRPIGAPLTVTRHQDNVILEFDRGRPTEVLDELYASLPAEDRRLLPNALHIGIELSEHTGGAFRGGDYLVRPIRGIDPNSGALAISERLNGDEVIQFHLRNAKSSTDDLRSWLTDYTATRPDVAATGALLFTCVERGEGLFGEPNHDSHMFREVLGDIALGGFFGLGEIGPVSGRTFLHAYTSTFALFRPAASS